MTHDRLAAPAAPSAPAVTLPSRSEAAGVRLVVVDMDGTLLDDDKNLPDGVWNTISALRERGITFTPASGRQYASLFHMFEREAEGMVFLAENGAHVVRDGDELLSVPLDGDVVREAVRLARIAEEGHTDCGVVLCGTRSAYIERTDERFVDAALPYYLELETVADLLVDGGPVDTDDIVKVAIYDHHDAERNVLPHLGGLGDRAKTVLSSHHWVDVMSPGANKGAALRRLQQKLGITRDETMAFGDYRNDLEMLAESRFAIAMSNAHPDVLAAATHVAPPNTERGVLVALDEVFELGLRPS